MRREWQAIIWTTDDPVHGCTFVSLGHTTFTQLVIDDENNPSLRYISADYLSRSILLVLDGDASDLQGHQNRGQPERTQTEVGIL